MTDGLKEMAGPERLPGVCLKGKTIVNGINGIYTFSNDHCTPSVVKGHQPSGPFPPPRVTPESFKRNNLISRISTEQSKWPKNYINSLDKMN